MISKSSGAIVKNAYLNNSNDVKQAEIASLKKAEASISTQGDMSKIDQIKSSIESGEYKINLEALSQKIADELL
ncbi:MAG: flagellar biosynthesis anti-sigma factor FlgM [Sulfurimonas sp.]|nr:flagellar biosynthesis anti-sigma factor FlgM [Sulfurimonas sp.]